MVRNPFFIGLSGKAGAGKNTAAAYLERQGYQCFAFADALKDLLQVAFGFSHQQVYGDKKEEPDPRFGKSPRWVMQYLGTEVFRGIWPEIWLWHLEQRIGAFRSCGTTLVAVTDVRFRDEAAALRRLGAVLVRIERQVAGARTGIPGHVSETDLDGWGDWDHVVQNNGSESALLLALEEIIYGK